MLRFLQQFRLRDQVQPQRFAAGAVVVLARDLDQAAPAILPAVAGGGVAHAVAVGDAGDLFGLAVNAQRQGVRLVAHLARSIAQLGRSSIRPSRAGSFSRFMTLKMGRSASGVGR